MSAATPTVLSCCCVMMVDRHTHLCGRAIERQLLQKAYQRSKTKRCCDDCGHASTSGATAVQPQHDVTPPQVMQEVVMIQGHSGTGKTTLANSLVDEVIDNDLGLFLSGKFDLCSFQNPYQIFASAFAKFSQQVLLVQGVAISSCHHNNMARNEKIRQAIHEAIKGNEGKLLARMIPTLNEFFGNDNKRQDDNDNDDDDSSERTAANGKDAVRRLNFAFSRFVMAISSVTPLVLFLDDLQWSDLASLGLLQGVLESLSLELLQQCGQHQLLIICAYRNEGLDVDEEQSPQSSSSSLSPSTTGKPHISDHFRDFLKHVSSSTLIHVDNIILDNLDEEATCQLVAEHLGISPEMSHKLGPAIYAKSHGNPFHAVQLLSPLMVATCQALHRPNGGDDDDIHPRQQHHEHENVIFEIAEAAETVDELLHQRFTLLPPQAQQVLQIAACMGDSIDHQALCTVIDGDLSSDIDIALETSLRNSFLVFEVKFGEYRFTHDRVRQVVLSMIDNVNFMSFQIGHQLWTKSSPMFLTNKMFIVVNLLNHGTAFMQDRVERNKAAAINLEAGSKAVSMSAFQDAARYFGSGIDFLLGCDYWNDEYDLSLDLFSSAAEAELCNQNFHRVSELVEDVFRNARTVKDKLRAYVVQINSLGQRCNMEAATRVGVNVMRQLGEPLPRRVTNTTILLEIIKTRIALRGRGNAALLALRPMQDENKIERMYVLTNLLPYAFQGASNYVVVIAARLVRLCLRYGMHKWSANGFSAFGFVLCPVNRKEGYRLGDLALTIIERYGGQRELLPRVHVNFYGLVSHWRRPLEDSLKPLEHVIKIGMEVGDVEHAALAFVTLATYSLYRGKPLAQVAVMLNETTRRMRQLRQDGLLVLAEMTLSYVRILIDGGAPLENLLSGEATAASLLNDSTSSSSSSSSSSHNEVDSQLIPYCHFFLMAELSFLFGNLQLASQMLEHNRSLRFEPLASYLYIKARFVEALICTSLVRSSSSSSSSNNNNNRGGVDVAGNNNKKKSLSIAKADLKLLRAWAKDCPRNYQHKQRLVEAELASLSCSTSGITMSTAIGRRSSWKRHVQELYDQAIDGALKEGFIQEAALANELAGEFMNQQSDPVSAGKYWDDAHALYLQWGATEKANRLQTSRRRRHGNVDST